MNNIKNPVAHVSSVDDRPAHPLVMVVDDSATSISLYQYSLENLLIQFVSFQSPLIALDYLKQHKPDLIFLDIVMPVMDGLTFLKRLRELPEHKNTAVVMVTSKNYAQDRVMAKHRGALEFMIKPLRFQEIRDLVSKYIPTC
jgi:CheY-like chemotaxis protein